MEDSQRLQILEKIDRIMKKAIELQVMTAYLYKIKEEVIDYDFYEDLDLILEDFDYDEQRLLVHLLALMDRWHTQDRKDLDHHILH